MPFQLTRVARPRIAWLFSVQAVNNVYLIALISHKCVHAIGKTWCIAMRAWCPLNAMHAAGSLGHVAMLDMG